MEIILSRSASKFLEKHKERKRLIKDILEELKNFPMCSLEIKKLEGFKDIFRVKKGRIRIIFKLDKEKKRITVLKIGFRENIYEKI